MQVNQHAGCDWALRMAVPSRMTCRVAFGCRGGPATMTSLWAVWHKRLTSPWRMIFVGCWKSCAADQTCLGTGVDPWRGPCRPACPVCTGPVRWSSFSHAHVGSVLMPSVLPPVSAGKSNHSKLQFMKGQITGYLRFCMMLYDRLKWQTWNVSWFSLDKHNSHPHKQTDKQLGVGKEEGRERNDTGKKWE